MAVIGETINRDAHSRNRNVASALYVGLFALLGLTVICPIAFLVYSGFVVEEPGEVFRFGLQHWASALAEPRIVESAINTFNRVAVTTAIALPIALVVSWLVTRTDVPGGRVFLVCCWIAFFLPTLPVILGWMLLLDPDSGLLNRALQAALALDRSPFDIYGFWGIVFAHLVTKAIAVKCIFLIPAFRNLGAAIEEPSRVCGAGPVYTLIHIVVPALAPAIAVTLVISVIHALESFEIELVLGAPVGFYVYSTRIYQLVHEDPPKLGAATVLGLGILTTMLPLIVLQWRIAVRRRIATLTSGFRSDVLRLRHWGWPASLPIAAIATAFTIIPLALLFLATFMTVFGFFGVEQPYTVNHWRAVINDATFLKSTGNTVVLGLGAAGTGMLLAVVIAYIAVRTRYRLRALFDFLTWLPAGIPGVILGLGFLWMFLSVPLFSPLYGTIWALIVVVVLATLPIGVQLVKTSLSQLGSELEEASTVAGASRFYTLSHIVVPILGPTILTVGILIFAVSVRNIANIAMIVTAHNRPLAMLQVEYMVEGIYEPAAVVGVVIVLITCGVAGIALLIGRGAGIRL
jgi:iron(III) transport system permease protein